MMLGTYMAIMNTTTEMPAIASVDKNWSPVEGEFARLTRTSEPMRAIITSAISFIPTLKA